MIGTTDLDSKIASEAQSTHVPSMGLTTEGILMSPSSSYEALEVSKIIKPTQKWDVYSFGVILLELISRKYPLVQVGCSEMDWVSRVQVSIEDKKPLLDVLDHVLVEELHKEEEILVVLKIALACVQAFPKRRPSSEACCRVVGESQWSHLR